MMATKRQFAWRPWLEAAFLVLALFAFRSAVADHYHVPSGSMQATLEPGDRVLVDKRAYGWRIPFTDLVWAASRAPERGDVVIFDSPETGERLIKRVVALPGDRVRMRRGRLTVNGEVLTDGDGVERHGRHAARLDLDAGGGPDIPPTVVPAGHLLVLGDHRGNSRDGRFFGFIPVDAVYGRAERVYYRRGEGFTWQAL